MFHIKTIGPCLDIKKETSQLGLEHAKDQGHGAATRLFGNLGKKKISNFYLGCF